MPKDGRKEGRDADGWKEGRKEGMPMEGSNADGRDANEKKEAMPMEGRMEAMPMEEMPIEGSDAKARKEGWKQCRWKKGRDTNGRKEQRK